MSLQCINDSNFHFAHSRQNDRAQGMESFNGDRDERPKRETSEATALINWTLTLNLLSIHCRN
jgi:hypothetical protein